MKSFARVLFVAALALFVVGCGTTDDVRSKPKTNEGGTTVADGGDAVTTTTKADATTTAAPKEVKPAAAQASEYVGGNVDPAFGPGEPGELSVVAVGTPDGEHDTIPFVVRNNTAGPIYEVSATGKVTAGGKLVGSGEDQGVEPAVVAPGEIAFGYVYFSTTPPAGATVEITATASSEQDEFFGSVPMTIGTANIVPGDYSTSIVGEVTAPEDVEVTGPVNVFVLCVDAAGTLSGSYSGFTDGDASILPGATATYTVDVYGDAGCPTFLIGSSGYEAS
ncbi:MAG TPA: hypothetical protein VNS19_06155 [Acidimicrobiales bacterium]|nr:hypothetical protein [Acidimicrobiales bacterium]